VLLELRALTRRLLGAAAAKWTKILLLLILSESIDMQLFIFLALLPLHVSAPCSHLQVVFFPSI
jgi:hypothetical protein